MPRFVPRVDAVNQAGDTGAEAPSVCFVCEPGRLELQSLLLAASLRAAHPQLRLLAALPRDLPPATAEGLRRLGVQRVDIANPVAADYPIGHKIAALGAGEPAGLRVFMDSDMLCLRPLPWALLGSHALAAKPADLATFGDPQLWQRLYARLGLAAPDARVVTTFSQQMSYPYFNAGLVASTRAAELAEAWGRLCRRIDAMEDIQPRRPWLDQIGLPLAAAALGMRPRCLGEAWNFPAHIKPLQPAVYLAHYHHPAAVAREPALLARVQVLIQAHPWLAERLAREEAWSRVHHALGRLRRNRRRWPWRRPPPAPGNLLITGVPRSGTSYLCRCLDQLDDLAVVNEPAILFEGLRYGPEPWMVPVLHADLRAAIDAGEPVENKLDARGRLTEDTAVEERRAAYRPQLKHADWILATKNTLAYLARLEGLLRVMPEARIVLCIRHPADALASWKGTFAHLASGDPSQLPVGGLADPFLPAHLRRGLQDVAALARPAWRRAAWWRLLAEEIARWREHPRVALVRYEDLVADPAGEVARLLGPFQARAGRPAQPLAPSAPRSHRRQSLDADDWHALETLCAGLGESFGYDVSAP
jgi:hypothetical protein